MRKALNDNPMVQLGVLGLLALVVGFVLITQMNKGASSSSSSSPASSSEASVAPGTDATPTDSGATATPPADSTATTPQATTPASTTDTGTASPVAPSTGASAAAPPAGFVAGPGLPEPVVSAYKDNQAVVLLVVRRGGIDDEAVKRSVEGMSGLPDVALFVTNAGHVSRYSRIASGVTLDRVPALIVLRPRNLTHGGMPEALVSYGFRGPDSVAQAIHDALYKGRTDLPYYPK